MGWVALKVTRSKTSTGEILGNIAAIFPKIEQAFDIGSGYKTPDELFIPFPEFPVEAYAFTVPLGFEAAKSFGFGNAIDVSAHNGETWTLENGSKITISYSVLSSNTQRGIVEFYNSDGTSAGNFYVQSTRTGAQINWLPVWLSDGQYARMDGAAIYTSGTHKGEFYYSAGKVPYGGTNGDKYIFFKGVEPLVITDDPYGDGGVSGGGGGTGSFDGTGDDISIPSLPTLSATDAGFITLFNPTIGQMRDLASYMWSDLFDADGWKKIFADPMDAILGLSIVPVAIPSTGAKPVSVGNISTGVSMSYASTQYVEVDCGTLNVNEYWGAYLDYDPYTKAEIYLPYIGIHPVSTDDIMNKPVRVVYHVDILSGACCAYVQCGGTVLYSFIGQCSSSIPITGDNWTNVINGAISIAGSIGTMVATGGASAPMAIGQIASTAVNTMKPTVEKSGAMGGTGGMLGVQTPYLILTRPRQALPRDQNVFIGYPSFITENLGDLSGYTEIDSIHLENVPATESELSEIENLLKGGVIF